MKLSILNVQGLLLLAVFLASCSTSQGLVKSIATPLEHDGRPAEEELLDIAVNVFDTGLKKRSDQPAIHDRPAAGQEGHWPANLQAQNSMEN